MANKARVATSSLILCSTIVIFSAGIYAYSNIRVQDVQGGANISLPNSNPVRKPASKRPLVNRKPAVRSKPGQSKKLEAIRLDALAIPAGYMSGKGNPESFIVIGAGTEECRTGADCVRVTYKVGGEWGGVFWWPQSCGSSGTPEAWAKAKNGACGIDILTASGFKGVSKFTFWAKGQRGGEIVEFNVGAKDMQPIPVRSLGRITLTRIWKQYEIDLRGLSLNKAVALFSWVAADEFNPQGAVFYLDDIQFEGINQQ